MPAHSHLVKMFEAAGAEEHEGEEHEVVTGVDDGAGGEGSCAETHPAKNDADKDEQQEGAKRPAGLHAVHHCEGNTRKESRYSHRGDRPSWMLVLI